MKLYIKQRIFSLRDKYHVWDETGTPVFYVEGEFFTLGAKIHIYDMTGQERFFIQQKVFRFLPEYEIYKNSTLCAVIKKELTFFKHVISIESDYGQFSINGDFWGMDFTVSTNDVVIGSISKEWFNFADCYQLDIASSTDPAFFTALTIAIDNCIHNENS